MSASALLPILAVILLVFIVLKGIKLMVRLMMLLILIAIAIYLFSAPETLDSSLQ